MPQVPREGTGACHMLYGGRSVRLTLPTRSYEDPLPSLQQNSAWARPLKPCGDPLNHPHYSEALKTFHDNYYSL